MINGGGSKIFFVMKVSPERVTMFDWNCRKTQGFGCGIATRLLLLPFKFLQMTETTTASRRRGAAGAEPRNGTDRKLNHRVHRGGHFNQEGGRVSGVGCRESGVWCREIARWKIAKLGFGISGCCGEGRTFVVLDFARKR